MMFKYRSILLLSIILGFLVASLPANAQIPPPENPADVLSDAYSGKSYSPYASRDFPTFPLWGESS